MKKIVAALTAIALVSSIYAKEIQSVLISKDCTTKDCEIVDSIPFQYDFSLKKIDASKVAEETKAPKKFDVWTRTTTGEVIVAKAGEVFPLYGTHDFEIINYTYNHHSCMVRVTLKTGVDYQTYSREFHIEPMKKLRSQLYSRLNIVRPVGDYYIGGLTELICTAQVHTGEHKFTSSSLTPLKVYQPN